MAAPDPVPTAFSAAQPVDRLAGARRILPLVGSALRIARSAAPREFAFGVALQIASAVLLGVQLLIVRHLISALLTLSRDQSAPVSDVAPAFGLLLATTLLAGGITALLQFRQRLLAELVARATLDRIVTVAGRVELARFEDHEFHDQLERATNAALSRPVELVNALMTLMIGALTSVTVMVALFTLEPLLLPAVLVAGIPVVITTLINSRQGYVFEYGMTAHARERLHIFELLISQEAAKELRAFSATRFLTRRYDRLSDERVERVREFLRGRTRVGLTGTAATSLGGAIALGALILLLASGRTGISSAVAAAVAMQVLSSRLTTVTQSLGQLVEAGMFVSDLQVFLDLEAELDEPPAEEPPAKRFRSLEVRDLSFAYPGTDRQVLSDIDLDIRRGEVVALVGENGSGKTTLVKLICQFYEHTEGTIAFNGRDVRDQDTGPVRSGMTTLFQDFVQYHLSVRDNIVLGRPSRPPDDGAVEAAARRAGATELIESLPDGYDTRLGRQFLGGHELSGGQWQRLALARAFYRAGDFLIMDEPTAALDPRAEHRLFEQVRELAAGKSVLLISHRFSNVRMADRIYVLDRGRIAEHGDHDSLMAQDGQYAELFRLQASSYLGEQVSS